MPNERDDEAYLNPAAADLQGFEDGEEDAYRRMRAHRIEMNAKIMGFGFLFIILGLIIYSFISWIFS